jgi:hypothetical protein
MRMVIHDWNDLEEHGVDYLTGECCAVGLRVLCRLDEKGRTLMMRIFQKPFLDYERVILPRDMFGTICVFALFEAGANRVVKTKDGCYRGLEMNEDMELYRRWESSGAIEQSWTPIAHPRVGLDCMKMM